MRVHGNLSELIVQVAASEAVAAGFTEITTAHLVMALCRLSEARAPGEPGRDTRALREELAGLGIEPTTFRRRLRELAGRRGDPREVSGILHRTEPCKAVFERAASSPDGELPALLQAAFSSLFDLGIAQGNGQENEANGDSVPLGELTGRFRALRKFLAGAVHGQDHAVHKLSEGLFEAEMVPASGGRRGPRGLFVFAGPPGVGKTHAAELTAGFLDRPFKQFDLSAYSQGHEFGFLVGAPASFRGATPGALTDFVRRNPDAILLFDEVDTASPAVIQLFLQILDAGTVDDQFTRERVDFRRAILILTTNGARSLYEDRNAAGVHQANAGFYRSAMLDALSTEADPRTGLPLFPPALCSRLATGHLILFHHLSTGALVRVAGTAMEDAAALLQASFGQRFTWSDEVPLALVMREGPWADARSVRARASAFLKDEVVKVCQLWTDEHIDRAFGEIEEVRVGVDPAEAGEVAARLFYDQESPRVLLIAPAPLRERLESATGVVWGSPEDAGGALGLMAKEDFDFVLLDLTAKTSAAESAAVFDDVSSFQGPGATELHFDYRPLAARRFAAGQSLLRRLRTRFPEVAVFLLSPAGGPEGDSDDEWLAASVEAGGARGVLRFAEEASGEEVTEVVGRLSRRLRMERMAAELARSHQAVLFDTAPLLAEDRRRLRLRCRHFRRVRAVRGADRESVLSEVERPAVRFDDVVGAASAKQSLGFLRDYLREPRKYAASGVEVPRGVLLAGPPGTGKTLLARALAGECDCPFLAETATGFVTVWQGSGPENVRRLFARARRYAPSIVFLDEIDALGRRRRGAAGAGHGEEMALNALLTELDGFAGSTSRPVITVAATNLPEILDPALVRRFARVVEVELPTRAERESFLALRLGGNGARRVSAEAVSRIGAQTQGSTIADLERMLAEAAVLGLDGGAGIDDDVLIEAFERVTLGDPKRTAADPLRTARHEAGHALVLCELGSPPAYVSIVGRGQFAGYTALDPGRDRALTTKPELEDLLCQILAGREAERLFFGDEEGSSAGQSSDLERATEIAEAMVYELGMDPEVGFVRLDRRRPMAAPAAELCHSRVRSVLEDQGKRARAILERRRDALERVAESLLERGRLTQDELLARVSDAASGATGSQS